MAETTMETDTLYSHEGSSDVLDESDVSLHGMSNAELKLMQEITLRQMRETQANPELLLLGRVWYRLERERRRRNEEVAMLERMYFGR